MRKRTVMVSGGFDPLHVGHVQYITESSRFGDILVVALNSDEWLMRKKGYVFMPWRERSMILTQLHGVDWVVPFDDTDDTAIDAIQTYLKPGDTFANAGDRVKENTPELDYCIENSIVPQFGVVETTGESSQDYVTNAINQIYNSEERPWGSFRVLERGVGYWVKVLSINPGECTSLQRHSLRSERWVVLNDMLQVEFGEPLGYTTPYRELLGKGKSMKIAENVPHRLRAKRDNTQPVRVIECAYGLCEENDIVRLADLYGRV